MNILVVGSGGIGCELLKTLALSGAKQLTHITLVDLDTIDLSNLNRQFLFRRHHIGQSKCKVAAEAIRKQLNPPFEIIPYHANIITDPRFTLDWFRSFDFVMNALDNLEARRHVNKMCLAAGKPLVESGTAGLLGQATLHCPGESECFDCTAKAKPTVYPVCTIRSTPSKPIHCVVWAKSWLFTQLFGKTETEEPQQSEAGGDDGSEETVNATELEKLRQESRELQQLRAIASDSEEYAAKIVDKIFVRDIQRLLLDEETWKRRPENRPTPLDVESLREQLLADPLERLDGISRDHSVWSLRMSYKVFCDSCQTLGRRLAESNNGATTATEVELEFEKDDEVMMDFVAAATNLRAYLFGILPAQTRFQTKQMAGNIIPAIATTNAVISGFMSIIANRLIANLSRSTTAVISDRTSLLSSGIRSAYLISGNPSRMVLSESMQPPSKECAICFQVEYRQVEVNCSRQTLGGLVDALIRPQLGMGGDLQLIRSKDGALLYDFDFEDNMDTCLSDLKLVDGCTLLITDEDDPEGNDKVTVELFIKHSDELDRECRPAGAPWKPLRLKPRSVTRGEKRKADDESFLLEEIANESKHQRVREEDGAILLS